ncbi:lambda lysozyme [Synechococcus phage S-SZBM1]|uniref:Lambda lysozyme n=1 Tax=Synechococcus phage S-SZBM1 TaxID=2926475 RepID=A0AC61TSI5_9CAUD|nr:lambda lysozyme [Synechococcus phage S-SZBM1]UNH61183.1 lambda lysozyme [Synechococcus phage S-SZBM1]
MAAPKARLYKYVTPPKIKGGATIKIGGKSVASPTSAVANLIKATNSIGATANSIAIIVEDLNTTFGSNMRLQMKQSEEMFNLRQEQLEELKKSKKEEEDRKRKEEGRQKDLAAENTQEKKRNRIAQGVGYVAGGIVGTAFRFLKGLAQVVESVFRAVVVYEIFDWMSKKENVKKIGKMLEALQSIGKFLFNFVSTMVDLGLNGISDFLKNPLSFKGILGLLSFVLALGVLFNPAGIAKLGIKSVLTLFKAGKLIGGLKSFLMGLGNMMKGLLAFVKKRGAAALLVGGAAALGGYLLTRNNGEEKDEGDSEVDVELQALEKESSELAEAAKEKGDKPQKSTGGNVVPVRPQGAANGGWITGPMSGYPVSLDGGQSTSFIGHGTEWVGFPKAASGGAFVVPFDTPATRTNKGLTNMRMRQASAGGYQLPSFPQFSMGGFAPAMGLQVNLPEMAKGGLLDFIASGEGGYNSMNQGTSGGRIVGSTHSAKSKVGKNLTDMTLAEIIKRQDYLMNPKNPQQSNYGLFAVGRYQVIPGTMKSIVKKMGLDLNAKFDKQMQDKIGMGLIQHHRPYAWQYIQGKHNDRRGAMLELAREWASLPHPDTGRTVYGNGNAASHSVGEVAAALDAARSGKPMVTGSDISPADIASSGGDLAPSGDGGGIAPVEEPPTAEGAQNALMAALEKYLPDTAEVPGPNGLVPAKDTGDKLNEAQLKEEEAAAKAEGEGGKVTVGAVQAPPVKVGDTANATPPEPVILPSTYVIPANEFVKPRFGLLADISSEPVSLY